MNPGLTEFNLASHLSWVVGYGMLILLAVIVVSNYLKTRSYRRRNRQHGIDFELRGGSYRVNDKARHVRPGWLPLHRRGFTSVEWKESDE